MIFLKILIVIGACGVASALVSLIALHILPTGYEPIRDPVCNYATGRYGFLFRLYAASSGASGLCLVAALVASGAPRFDAWVIALTVYSAARLAIVHFPRDVEGPTTFRGKVHIVLDIITFMSISLSSGFLIPRLSIFRVLGVAAWARVWPELLLASIAIGVFTTLIPVILAIPAWNRKIIGLNERCLFLAIILWFAVAFLPLLPLH